MSDLNPIPINALFDSTDTGPNEAAGFDVLQTLREAEVIVGRDVMTGNEFILFGRTAIQQIASGSAPEGVPVLCIALDQGPESDDLDRITGLISAIKGRHDYIG